MNAPFTTYQFDLEVITPVHVGMAQEKNYVRGLDFVLEADEVLVVNTDKLFRLLTPTQLQALTVKLADGNANSLETMLKPLIHSNPGLVMQRLPVGGKPNDIRRLYRTGMGQYAIPGSSIKGAIRSVLLAELKKLPNSNRLRDELEKLMGGITNNLMRYIQVGDVSLPTEIIEVRRTKVFSADNDARNVNPRGEWKHGQYGKHSSTFTDGQYGADAFVTFYEVAVPNPTLFELPVLTIRLGTDLPGELGRYAMGSVVVGGVKQPNVPNYENLLAGKTGDWLLRTIRAHTLQYLTREKKYFLTYANVDLDKQRPILERLDELTQSNNESRSCLLRVGAGVGFHSITGDWQQRSQDHTSERKRDKDEIWAKTRKFAFEEENRAVELLPMGFIKLTLQTPESKQARLQKLELARAEAEQEAVRRRAEREAAAAEAKRKAEAARLAAEEARKPKWFEGVLPKGKTVEVDAEVVKSGRPNTVKLYVKGYETKTFSLTRSTNPIEPGAILVVEAMTKNDTTIYQVNYLRHK